MVAVVKELQQDRQTRRWARGFLATPEVLELSSVVLCHQFHSKDWYDFLRKKIPLPDDGFEVSQRLEPGEAIAFSKGLANVTSNNEDEEPKAYMKLQMRMRLTADGGASRRPTQRRRNAE